MNRTLYCAELLLAGRNLDPITGGAVLVESGRIAAVGKQGDFSGYSGERISRPVIMPGLVDCHAHMALDAGIHNWPAQVADPEAEHVLRALAAMEADLRSGVTTARYMGDKYFIDAALRRALSEDRLTGPRALVATRGIKARHAHGLVGYAVDGVDARRQFVRENLAGKPDWIKLFITDTVLRPVMHCYPTPEEIRVIVEEAHNVGVPVAAHVAGGPGWERCIEAGVDTFEHGYFVTAEQIAALVRAGRWLTVTPTPIMSEYYAERCAHGMAQGFVDSRPALEKSMRMSLSGGVKYAVGSDGLHGFLHNDVRRLVDFGASTRDALQAATIRGAELCRVDAVTGSIDAGKCADIIGLEADPTRDIAALSRVSLVVRSGRAIVTREEKANIS